MILPIAGFTPSLAGEIAVVRLDLTEAGLDELGDALRVLSVDSGARAAVVTIEQSTLTSVLVPGALGICLDALERTPIPTIAAIRSTTLSSELVLAVAADLAVIDEGAELAVTGGLPGSGVDERLVTALARRIGSGAAAEMTLLGRAVSAERARDLGLACEVAAAGQALDRAEAIARSLAQIDPAPLNRAVSALRGSGDELRLRQLEDQHEILELLHRYCHDLDFGLLDDLSELWLDDGELHWPGQPPHVGHEAILAAAGRLPAGQQLHLGIDPLIVIDGDDARVTSYFVRVAEVDGRPATASFGRYRDELRRDVDGHWRFARRHTERMPFDA
jgi:SnoaL-like domain/Enoyl-CoA hydratase/isomerase